MTKRLLVTIMAGAVGVLLVASVQAQGTLGNVSFANSTATKITNGLTMAPVVGGVVNVGLYYKTGAGSFEPVSYAVLNPNQLLSDASLNGVFVGTSTAAALYGIIQGGGTRNITGTAPGDTVWLQVRAWSVGYNTYDDAVATGLPTVVAGVSNPIQMALGGGTLPTPGMVANGLKGFVVEPVPEPSTLVLGAAGLLGLYLIRRRK